MDDRAFGELLSLAQSVADPRHHDYIILHKLLLWPS